MSDDQINAIAADCAAYLCNEQQHYPNSSFRIAMYHPNSEDDIADAIASRLRAQAWRQAGQQPAEVPGE